MKNIIPIILFASFLFFQPGCKNAIDDGIDCTLQSTLLSVTDVADTTNSKLIHFEFINGDTGGSFTLDPNIEWNFGDGNTVTSTNLSIDHIYNNTGSYKVTATYTLRKGSSSCSGPKDKNITVN